MKIAISPIKNTAFMGIMITFMLSNAYGAELFNQSSVPYSLPYITENAAYAQYIFDMKEGSVQKIFTDETNVRRQPNLDAQVIEQLQAGQAVAIVQKASVLKLGNRSANWYKIRYEKDHDTHTGYIWGANLSVGYRQLGEHTFLYGVNPSQSSQNNDDVDMVVKVIKDNRVIQSITFGAYSSSLNSVDFKWRNVSGLQSVDKVLIAGVSAEACGLPSLKKYMLWHEGKLIELPIVSSISEAGLFYNNEDYIFPNDKGGRAGYIILNKELETTEEFADGKVKTTKQPSEQTLYQWRVDSEGRNGRLVQIN